MTGFTSPGAVEQLLSFTGGIVTNATYFKPHASYDILDNLSVRADVIYLKQDFSVLQPVANAKPWPRMQRFDYLVRKRELNAEEAARLTRDQRGKAETASYPQRDAVLWALLG